MSRLRRVRLRQPAGGVLLNLELAQVVLETVQWPHGRLISRILRSHKDIVAVWAASPASRLSSSTGRSHARR